MSTRVPVLDVGHRVTFSSPSTFVEAIQAALSEQWLFVTPRVSVQLGLRIRVTLALTNSVDEIRVTGVPGYWRGAYLGMQVFCEEQDGCRLGRDLVAKYEGVPDPVEGFDGGGGTDEVAVNASVPLTVPAHPNLLMPLADDGLQGLHLGELVEQSLRGAAALPSSASVVDEDVDMVGETTDQSTTPGLSEFHGPEMEETPQEVPGARVSDYGMGTAGRFGPGEPTESGVLLPNNLVEILKEVGLPERNEERMPSALSYYSLLLRAAASELTGILEISVPEGSYRIYLRSGAVRAVDLPTHSFDRHMGLVLAREGFLKSDQLEELAQESSRDSRSITGLSYERGWVSLDVLSRLMRVQKERLIRQVLNQRKEGTYRLVPKPYNAVRFDPSQMPLAPMITLFVRQALMAMEQESLVHLIEPYVRRFPVFKEHPVFRRDALWLTRRETELADLLLTGVHSVEELPMLVQLTPKELNACLVLLHHFGSLSLRSQRLGASRGEAVIRRLEDQLSLMMKADHFTRLGVHWASHPSRIDQAFTSLGNRYGCDSTLHGFSAESARLCEGIERLYLKSFALLRDPLRRKAYRIETHGLARVEVASRVLYKQAQHLHDSGHVAAAVHLLQAALDLLEDPAWRKSLKEWTDMAEG